MSTDWLKPSHESPFEACKDKALKEALSCAGQWTLFSFQDIIKPDEQIFAYFDREHEEIGIDNDVSFSTSDPIIECRYADFDNVPKQGDFVKVIEKLANIDLELDFEIVDRNEPDEQGAILFTLKLLDGERTVNPV